MRFNSLCGLLAIVMASASAAFAAPVPWSNANGSAISFDWSNGHSDDGLFGSPALVGDKFVFFPSAFKAASANGTGHQLSDRLQFTLLIKPNYILQQIVLNEEGNYSILGAGAVHVSGGLWAKNLSGPGLINAQLNAPGMPTFVPPNDPSAPWSATTSVLPTGWTEVEVVFNNILQAITSGGSVSDIEKTVIEASIVTTLIPEPGSLGLLLGGAALLLRRRGNTR